MPQPSETRSRIYARTSTVEQKAGLEAQLRDLKAAGVEKVFQEQLSSVDAERPQLEAALDFAREGDVLVITKIDRIARSVANLCDMRPSFTRRAQASRC
jgi:DNA invertase Pin-like site-specific DNA recombinase